MKTLHALSLALAFAAMTIPAGALAANGDISGNYLLTAVRVKPTSYQGQTVCVTLNENGGVLGWAHSGRITINGDHGQFFIVKREISAWIIGKNGAATFSAYLAGGGTISNAAFSVTDSSGDAKEAGSFTVQRNGC